jgi:hypothetical protein
LQHEKYGAKSPEERAKFLLWICWFFKHWSALVPKKTQIQWHSGASWFIMFHHFPTKTTILGVHTPFPGNLLGFGFHSSPGFCKFLNQATQWSDKFIMIVE